MGVTRYSAVVVGENPMLERGNGIFDNVEEHSNERTVVNSFIRQMCVVDPDVIASYNLERGGLHYIVKRAESQNYVRDPLASLSRVPKEKVRLTFFSWPHYGFVMMLKFRFLMGICVVLHDCWYGIAFSKSVYTQAPHISTKLSS